MPNSLGRISTLGDSRASALSSVCLSPYKSNSITDLQLYLQSYNPENPESETCERVACIVKYSFEPWHAQQVLSRLAASVQLDYFSVAFTPVIDPYAFEMSFGFRYAETKVPLFHIICLT
jgi:hypothetical protein